MLPFDFIDQRGESETVLKFSYEVIFELFQLIEININNRKLNIFSEKIRKFYLCSFSFSLVKIPMKETWSSFDIVLRCFQTWKSKCIKYEKEFEKKGEKKINRKEKKRETFTVLVIKIPQDLYENENVSYFQHVLRITYGSWSILNLPLIVASMRKCTFLLHRETKPF